MNRENLRLAGYGVAALLVILVGARFIGGGGGGDGATGVVVDPAAARPERPRRETGAAAVVQVAGEVKQPGVYRVRAGSRVIDAVQRAGGLTSGAEQAGINLVARVQDGQQIVVPRRGAAAAATGSGAAGAAGASPGPVSLSQATAAQLESLDGIGPALAQRIVQYRQAHGGFRSIDELRQVQGIGEKRFEALKKSVAP